MLLKNLQTANNKYLLLQMDHLDSLAERMGLDLAEPDTGIALRKFKKLQLEKLSGNVSGVICDPFFSLPEISKKANKTGLILRLEDNLRDSDKQAIPRLLENWGVEFVSNNYAVAKMELYYHPGEEQALIKKQLLAELADFCKYEQIDFLVQLRIYDPLGGNLTPEAHAAAQLEAVQEVRKSCDLLAVEYPGSALACANLDAELDTPWILLSRHEPEQESYDTLKANLRVALENGASGLSVGKVLLSELNFNKTASLAFDFEKIANQLETQVLDKLIELNRIILEGK